MNSWIKKFFVVALASLLVFGNLSFATAATVKSPQVTFKMEKEATNDNYKQFGVEGSAKLSADITVSATDKEKTMLVKTSKTNNKGDFKVDLNLASLVDGKITVKVVATNKKGSNTKSQTTVKTIKEDVIPPVTPEPPVVVEPESEPEPQPEPEPPVIVPPVTPEPPTEPVEPPVTPEPEPTTPVEPVIPPVDPTTPTEPVTPPVDPPQTGESKIYTLTNDQEIKWNISDKGKNAAATTAGLNDAIEWAGKNGYTDVKLEDGTYLIAATGDDQSVNMISNMNLLLADNAILQKETNNEQGYAILNFGNVDNAGVKGGKIIGDRETHDYSKPNDGLETNTHEWGAGIATNGSSNITIDDVLIKGTTGDGVGIFATTVSGGELTDFEKGAIDDNGKPVVKDGKIRTVGRTETNFDNRKVFEEYDNLYMWLPEGTESNKFDIYFYDKTKKFIKSQKQLDNYTGEAKIPENADYFVAVFDADKTDVKITRMTIDLSEDITIKNSELDNSRRQGVSVVGSRNVTIQNNHIHDIRGVAPESGIDIEPGYYPSTNTIIKGNKIENNIIQIVLAYGEGAEIADNTFIEGDETSIGLYAWKDFKNMNAHNNIFDGSGMYNDVDNSKMVGNMFLNGAQTTLTGKNQTFSDATFHDSSLSVGDEDGQIIKDVVMNLEKYKQEHDPFIVNSGKISMSNITVNKTANVSERPIPVIAGNGNEESTYDNIVLKDKTQKDSGLPAGKFTNVDFDFGSVDFNKDGKTSINTGTIKSDHKLIWANDNAHATFDNIKFEQRGDTGHGASMYIEGAKQFNILNSEIDATNNENETDLIKFEGSRVYSSTFKDVVIKTKKGLDINAINTTNTGEDAPAYHFENVKIHNGKLALKANDVKINVELLTD